MPFRDRWMTAIVRSTSRIYRHKQALLEAKSFFFLQEFFLLLIEEFFLFLLAIPFLGITADKNSPLSSPTFQIRRIITVSALSLIIIIWLVKGVFVVTKEIILASGTPFSIETISSGRLVSGTAAQQAIGPASPLLTPPRIELVAGDYRKLTAVYGSAPAGSTVHIFIEEQSEHRAFIVSATSSENGTWSLFDHAGKNSGMVLKKGVYHITAVAENMVQKTRSIPSQVVVWRAEHSPLDWLFEYGSFVFNSVVAVFIIGTVVITFLTLS